MPPLSASLCDGSLDVPAQPVCTGTGSSASSPQGAAQVETKQDMHFPRGVLFIVLRSNLKGKGKKKIKKEKKKKLYL